MIAGQVAFVSGATAAVGSGVVKVPIAVCIRSVQAGVYPNVVQAARSIVQAAGVRGLFTVSALLLRETYGMPKSLTSCAYLPLQLMQAITYLASQLCAEQWSSGQMLCSRQATPCCRL